MREWVGVERLDWEEGERLQAKVSEPHRCTVGAWEAGGATSGGGGGIPERISDLCRTPSPQDGDVGGAGGGPEEGQGMALTGRAPSGR